MNILKGLIRQRQKTKESSLRVTNEGFYIESEISNAYIGWLDITKLTVYKMDLIAIDLVCLEVEAKLSKTYIIHEEMEGWTEVITEMNRILNLDSNWLANVTLPPFQRNETIIYQKVQKIHTQDL